MTGEPLYLRIHDAENRIWRVDVSGDLNVGTVHNANPIFPDRWQWSITARPARRGAATSGTTETREQAIAEFRAAWDLAEVDIEAWRRHMTDVERAAATWAAHKRGG